MNTKLLFFAFLLPAFALSAQEQQQPQQQTLFNHARVTGGFGGPIFSLSSTNGRTGYGSGGGGGVHFNQFYAGLFGMGETFGPLRFNHEQLSLGYGGLWLGYTTPSYKLVHLYTSLKLAGGGAVVTHFDDDDWEWDYDNDFPDIVFVAVPEAGLELNIARWLRLSGSVGYRLVDGFEGWNDFGKTDLNAPVYALTMRFGWFGAKRTKAAQKDKG